MQAAALSASSHCGRYLGSFASPHISSVCGLGYTQYLADRWRTCMCDLRGRRRFCARADVRPVEQPSLPQRSLPGLPRLYVLTNSLGWWAPRWVDIGTITAVGWQAWYVCARLQIFGAAELRGPFSSSYEMWQAVLELRHAFALESLTPDIRKVLPQHVCSLMWE